MSCAEEIIHILKDLILGLFFLLGIVGQFSSISIAPQVDIKLNVISKFSKIV
jgi:hypothetical protein